ncbi:uncharacterized protein LOC116021780 [Ipomoea triloba]|uniref:uncharacterized protein LOC116021780 n=1 Tax=Ipomoea triloba TaxID=35885 RepID=UPI00125D2261|nr:uncharacterized protein LOC116021780 [Ipomoea triloba]
MTLTFAVRSSPLPVAFPTMMGGRPPDPIAADLQKIRRLLEELRCDGFKFSPEAISCLAADDPLPRPSLAFVQPLQPDRPQQTFPDSSTAGLTGVQTSDRSSTGVDGVVAESRMSGPSLISDRRLLEFSEPSAQPATSRRTEGAKNEIEGGSALGLTAATRPVSQNPLRQPLLKP